MRSASLESALKRGADELRPPPRRIIAAPMMLTAHDPRARAIQAFIGTKRKITDREHGSGRRPSVREGILTVETFVQRRPDRATPAARASRRAFASQVSVPRRSKTLIAPDLLLNLRSRVSRSRSPSRSRHALLLTLGIYPTKAGVERARRDDPHLILSGVDLVSGRPGALHRSGSPSPTRAAPQRDLASRLSMLPSRFTLILAPSTERGPDFTTRQCSRTGSSDYCKVHPHQASSSIPRELMRLSA